MEPTSTIAAGLADNPLAYLSALLIGAVAYLAIQLKKSFELRLKEAREHAESLLATTAESSRLAWELAALLKNIERFAGGTK